MRKGRRTRLAILDHAAQRASAVGLSALTIGMLAEDLELSKSGLFAHFGSKDALEREVLDHAAEQFVERVVRPALRQSRGVARLRALFEGWLAWDAAPGGCVFAQAAAELDDQPGPVRDRLVELQRAWMGVIVTSARKAIEAGAIRPDVEPEQFAQDLYGVMLAFHHAWRLLGDRQAERRARRAFDALLAASGPHNSSPVTAETAP